MKEDHCRCSRLDYVWGCRILSKRGLQFSSCLCRSALRKDCTLCLGNGWTPIVGAFYFLFYYAHYKHLYRANTCLTVCCFCWVIPPICSFALSCARIDTIFPRLHVTHCSGCPMHEDWSAWCTNPVGGNPHPSSLLYAPSLPTSWKWQCRVWYHEMPLFSCVKLRRTLLYTHAYLSKGIFTM